MKISVVIPAYNAAQTVGRAIDSVLAQTRPADEVFVIDDGSSDGTAEVIRSYGDKVTLIQQQNAGVSVARNAGIEAATGDWIAFLDSDDEWLPEKLQCQTEHLQRNPDLAWTYANLYKKEGQDECVEAHTSPRTAKLLAGGEIFDDYLEAFVNQAFAWTGTVMVRRDIFDTVGDFKPGMKRAQDTDVWFRIAYQFPKVGYISTPLAIYHMDTPGSSIKINDQVDVAVTLIERHLELSKQANRQDAFRPCATAKLQQYIRQYLSESRRCDAMQLMGRFKDLLPARFLREMYFRICLPGIGPMIADFYLGRKRKQ